MLRKRGYLHDLLPMRLAQIAEKKKGRYVEMKMNKKVLASLIAAGILTTGTALANPFDDVPRDHWSYDAVKTLADQGIVDGYGDGTYRGDKLMTRYEMAQIVGRAISQGKLAGPETKKTLDQLSAEYADELNALGVKVDKIDKETAGVRDLKISHWIQTENTYGNSTDTNDDKLHEYELEYRLTVEKQIAPKLSALMQIETKTYWDQPATLSAGDRDNVYTRLAYITYKPDEKNTIIAGKNAYWLAGGLLGDDYIEGVDWTTKLGDKTTFEVLHGRYWVDRDIRKDGLLNGGLVLNPNTGEAVPGADGNDQITYAGINTKFGVVDFGAHYLYGQNGLLRGDTANIWGATIGFDLGGGYNLSLGYAEDSEQDDDNSVTKVQVYKKLGKVDTFLQYWKQEQNYNTPMENGNHMAWYRDMYGGWREDFGGVEGFRLILGYPISVNCYAEAWYGDYEDIVSSESSQKFGWALTFQY